jgi:hypothetical protein
VATATTAAAAASTTENDQTSITAAKVDPGLG